MALANPPALERIDVAGGPGHRFVPGDHGPVGRFRALAGCRLSAGRTLLAGETDLELGASRLSRPTDGRPKVFSLLFLSN